MTDRRVQFDFEITFANGGGIQGQGFRLDIHAAPIADEDLADAIVKDLRLLMVDRVRIMNKVYLEEPHKRATPPPEGSGLVELSHSIVDGMVTYPGLPAPVVTDYLARDAFHIGRIDMVANTGTYLDAPFHRYPDGDDIAALDAARLHEVPGVVTPLLSGGIGREAFADIETWGKAVLVRTDWSDRFGREDYLGGHPHLTEDGAQRLVEGGALLVGIDSANIDDTTGDERPAHSVLLGAGIPIVEHLTNLSALPPSGFTVTALPAPVVGLGTFPVRVVARW